jgi:hypothetical protein
MLAFPDRYKSYFAFVNKDVTKNKTLRTCYFSYFNLTFFCIVLQIIVQQCYSLFFLGGFNDGVFPGVSL